MVRGWDYQPILGSLLNTNSGLLVKWIGGAPTASPDHQGNRKLVSHQVSPKIGTLGIWTMMKRTCRLTHQKWRSGLWADVPQPHEEVNMVCYVPMATYSWRILMMTGVWSESISREIYAVPRSHQTNMLFLCYLSFADVTCQFSLLRMFSNPSPTRNYPQRLAVGQCTLSSVPTLDILQQMLTIIGFVAGHVYVSTYLHNMYNPCPLLLTPPQE